MDVVVCIQGMSLLSRSGVGDIFHLFYIASVCSVDFSSFGIHTMYTLNSLAEERWVRSSTEGGKLHSFPEYPSQVAPRGEKEPSEME